MLSVNYGSAEGKVAKVSITGGTVNGALDTRSYDPSTNELTSIDDATKATIAVTGGTFSSDPTKYVVEDSAINKNDDGTFGVAKAYLAKVGDTSYYTMDEAFKAQTASSEAIVLLRDYTTGSTFNSGSINRTVDLERPHLDLHRHGCKQRGLRDQQPQCDADREERQGGQQPAGGSDPPPWAAPSSMTIPVWCSMASR